MGIPGPPTSVAELVMLFRWNGVEVLPREVVGKPKPFGKTASNGLKNISGNPEKVLDTRMLPCHNAHVMVPLARHNESWAS